MMISKGHDEGITLYNRREIATMISIQHEEGAAKRNTGVHKGIYLFFESINIMKKLRIYNFKFYTSILRNKK